MKKYDKTTKQINTKRLKIRNFRQDDAKQIFETWIADPEVAKYMVWNAQEKLEDTEEWLKKCISKYENNNNFNWGIELKEIRKLIGSISANKTQEDKECYEIGYALGKEYWGKGYATEALTGIVEYLIKEHKIKKFMCRYAKGNEASGNVIRKVGFQYIGEGKFTSIDGKRKYESEEYYLEI